MKKLIELKGVRVVVVLNWFLVPKCTLKLVYVQLPTSGPHGWQVVIVQRWLFVIKKFGSQNGVRCGQVIAFELDFSLE